MVYNSVEEIYQTINKTRSEIETLVSGLSEEQLNYHPDEKAWSIAQIAEHLSKVEVGLVPLFNKLLRKAEESPSGFDGKFDPAISFAHHAAKVSNVKLEAPERIRPEGNATMAESMAQLVESRKAICALQPRFESLNLSEMLFPHPVLGALNAYEWLAFIGLHEARHLAQISRVLASMN